MQIYYARQERTHGLVKAFSHPALPSCAIYFLCPGTKAVCVTVHFQLRAMILQVFNL